MISWFHRCSLLLLASAACLWGTVPLQAGQVFTATLSPEAPVEVSVDSWLESCPSAGFVPLRVNIRNRTAEAHTWTIAATSGSGADAEVTLTVEAGREGERVFYAPVLVHPSAGYYNASLHIRVEGYGLQHSGLGTLHNSTSYGNDRTAFIAMSSKLHAQGWSSLEDRFKRGGAGMVLQGCKVEMNAAPEDWRGYAGLAQLWMEESEWTSLTAAARAAIMEWVALGGQVYVLVRDAAPDRPDELGFPKGEGDARPHGAGKITAIKWTADALPENVMMTHIRAAEGGSRGHLLGKYNDRWSLARSVGPLTLRSGLIFGFILIFGLLVGPVNLFWLAPAGRRQRLFWTTPALSLAGSGVLLGLMIVQDGFGGAGTRTILAVMLPEQKRLAISQEQVSKTGVLLSRAFDRKDADLMVPVRLTEGPDSYDYYRRREEAFNLAETEGQRNGEWFSSRAVQAHLLQAVRPSRATVEFHLSAGGASDPSVISTVESPLKRVFIIDENNKIWTAEDVGTGEKKVLRASDVSEYEKWFNEFQGWRAGPVMHEQMAGMRGRRGHAFAEVEGAEKFAIGTLPSIRWSDERVLLAGPYVER